jgi:putative oxidoreductase
MKNDKWGLVVGRFLLSVIFILSGAGKLMQFAGTASMMSAKGIPLAKLALAISLLIEIGGGLALLTGFKVRYVAPIMALWLVPVTLVFHNFWAYQGQEAMTQQINFLKNLAIVGGLLVTSSTARVAAAADASRGVGARGSSE